MTEEKKLSRRDAIKLIGATAGASALANIPSKWSKPTLAGGMIPAHAQTSGCSLPNFSMLVKFHEVNGTGISSGFGALGDANYSNNLIQTSGVETTTGYTIFFPCYDGCVGFGFDVESPTTATVQVTINGVVVAYWVDITNDYHFVEFDGTTGNYSVDVPVGCWGGRSTDGKKSKNYYR